VHPDHVVWAGDVHKLRKFAARREHCHQECHRAFPKAANPCLAVAIGVDGAVDGASVASASTKALNLAFKSCCDVFATSG
jgi:hypothetical protein